MKRGMLLIVVLACAVTTAGALGHGTKRFGSTVKITAVTETPKRGTHYFHGVVKSKKKGCYKARGVSLYSEEGPGGESDPAATTTTNPEGKWTVPVLAFYPGDWYAKVEKVNVGTYVCKADTSNTYVNAP